MSKSVVLKRVIAGVVIVGIGAGGYVGYNNFFGAGRVAFATSEEMPGGGMPMRIAAPVEKSDLVKTVAATGVVSLSEEVSVYAESQLKVAELTVEAGDKVQAGDVLVKYDVETAMKNLVKQIAQTELDLSNQRLTLESMSLPVSESSVRQLENSVSSAEKQLYDAETTVENTEAKIAAQLVDIANAETDLQNAETEINKNKILLEAGGISESEYEAFITKRDAALTTIEKAKSTLNDLYNQLESNKMGIESAQKSLTYAKENLDDTKYVLKEDADKIKYKQQQNAVTQKELTLQDYKDQLDSLVETTVSPIDGTITQILVSRGKLVDADEEIIKMADFSKLIVKANITEYDATDLAVGQEVIMTSDGMIDMEYIGKISKIGDSAVTTSTDTSIPIEISIDNIEKLKPGFNLDIDITVANKQNVMNIPVGAVQRDAETGEQYVYAMNPESGTIKKTPVKLGIMSDMNIEVLEGLAEKDMIITSPTNAMRDGMTIEEAIQAGAGAAGQITGSSGRQGGAQNVMIFGGPAGGGSGSATRTRTVIERPPGGGGK